MVTDNSVGAVTSHDIHQADRALRRLSSVQAVATQITNLRPDSRRKVQVVNPLNGQDVLFVGVWAGWSRDDGQALGDHPGFICRSNEDRVVDLVLRAISWASL